MAHFLTPLLRTPDRQRELRNERTGLTLATVIEPAFDSGRRRKGLLGRAGIPAGAAVLLAPCAAVHTMFMRFSIDVVFAGRDGVVTKVCPDVRPWRIAFSTGAFVAIELAVGVAAATGTRPGDRLTLAEVV
jgi:uncharacterized protein